MDVIRRWFVLCCAIFAVIIGFSFGLYFLRVTLAIYQSAAAAGGSRLVASIVNLTHSTQGVLAVIVFGLTMTNVMIICSTLTAAILLRERSPR